MNLSDIGIITMSCKFLISHDICHLFQFSWDMLSWKKQDDFQTSSTVHDNSFKHLWNFVRSNLFNFNEMVLFFALYDKQNIDIC